MINRLIEAPAARLAWVIGAGLGSGLFPVAPATAGSLLALAIYWWSPLTGDDPALFVLISAGFLLGIWATGKMSTAGNPDPKQAVWDEFIGMWATCVLLPKTLPWLVHSSAFGSWTSGNLGRSGGWSGSTADLESWPTICLRAFSEPSS